MSKTTTPGGFDDRDKWALRMQHRYAIPVYREYWAVAESDITEVDDYRDQEVSAAVLDCDGGTDKIVNPETGIRHVAQRFRTRAKSDNGYVFTTDFSIRTSSYSGKDTEYDKVMNAWRNDGTVPAIYAFGIADGFNRAEALESGFREFHFINYPAFLRQFDNGHITPNACYENGDGSEALYFAVSDLADAGVIRDSVSGQVLASAWREGQTSNKFPTAPGVKTTGQVDLFEFGDSDE